MEIIFADQKFWKPHPFICR